MTYFFADFRGLTHACLYVQHLYIWPVLWFFPFASFGACAVVASHQVVDPTRPARPSDLWSGVEDILRHVEEAYFPALVSVLPQARTLFVSG